MASNGDDYYMNYLLNNNNLFTGEDIDSFGFEDPVSGYYDSSSPEGVRSPSAPSKNIVMERNRRRKLSDRLLLLRSVVPNISKMDRASIIKDAIEYIKNLHEQERRVKSELHELESVKSKKITGYYDQFEQDLQMLQRSKRRKAEPFRSSRSSPLEVLDLSVSNFRERIVKVSLTCCRRADSMVKLCEVFESLKLKIITATITAVSGRLLKTVFIEAEQEERDGLKIRIETAIAGLIDPLSPMSI